MAKFSAYYRLCPLIDQKTFIGVTDESVNGCVIITLGKNMVIRYKLSDQKQVSSWSGRDKLSAPVVYDTLGQQYIGVFNNNQISTWEESCVQLNKLKRIKFATPIECVLTSESCSTPVVVFQNGCVLSLQQAINRRKEQIPENSSFLKDETICETHLISLMGFNVVVLFTKSIEEEYSIHLIPMEEGLLGQSLLRMKRKAEDDVKLVSYVVVNYETCRLLTLWSDGELFSLELPTPDSEQFPGKSLTTLTDINTSYQSAILPLSSTHIAIYGADRNDEGATLFIFNSQLCVTQCKQNFKLYTTPARLWAGGTGSVLLADGQYLVVVPYHLGKQRLVALLGSQNDMRPMQQIDWGHPTKQEKMEDSSSSLEKIIQTYVEEGMSQRMICQILIEPYLDAKDVGGLKELLKTLTDIPESCIITVFSTCAEEIEEPGFRDLLRTCLTLPVTSDLSILHQLRHKLDLSSVLTLLREVSDAMIETPSDPQLIEWATLLLDAYYQQYLLSKDEAVVETLSELKIIVDNQVKEMTVWQQLESLLLHIQRRQHLPDSTHCTNTSYSIEQITLY